MIPPLTTAGYRVIAPDMMGMGRSDKPVEFEDYTYLEHVQWVERFVDQLGIRDITVFVQDWGSLIGLRVVGDHPEWFSRVVVANGQLPVVPPGLKLVSEPDPPVPDPSLVLPFDACQANGPTRKPLVPVLQECFGDWVWYAMVGTEFRASEVVDHLTTTTQRPAALAAYDAPFPDRIYMTGARTFPALVNRLGEPPGNSAARAVFDQWTKPLLTLFGRLDPVLGTEAVQAQMRDTVPGARGQAHWAYPDATTSSKKTRDPTSPVAS